MTNYRSDVGMKTTPGLESSPASRWSAPGQHKGRGFNPAPFPSSAMSLGSAIPWQVALQQSLPPLYRPESLLYPLAETVNHHLAGAGEFSTGDLANSHPALTAAPAPSGRRRATGPVARPQPTVAPESAISPNVSAAKLQNAHAVLASQSVRHGLFEPSSVLPHGKTDVISYAWAKSCTLAESSQWTGRRISPKAARTPRKHVKLRVLTSCRFKVEDLAGICRTYRAHPRLGPTGKSSRVLHVEGS